MINFHNLNFGPKGFVLILVLALLGCSGETPKEKFEDGVGEAGRPGSETEKKQFQEASRNRLAVSLKKANLLGVSPNRVALNLDLQINDRRVTLPLSASLANEDWDIQDQVAKIQSFDRRYQSFDFYFYRTESHGHPVLGVRIFLGRRADSGAGVRVSGLSIKLRLDGKPGPAIVENLRFEFPVEENFDFARWVHD